MSTVAESSLPTVPETRWLYTYDELVAEMQETNQPHELWDGELVSVIDPEPEIVEVLALVNGRYELIKRSQHGQTATSQLLPGFEVSVGYLFRGA
jgi:Uma2 family endonuclease